MYKWILYFSLITWTSCNSSEPKLTPRLMKEVDQEFRKSRKAIKEEMDSLCAEQNAIYLDKAIDSLVELRLDEFKRKRVEIPD